MIIHVYLGHSTSSHPVWHRFNANIVVIQLMLPWYQFEYIRWAGKTSYSEVKCKISYVVKKRPMKRAIFEGQIAFDQMQNLICGKKRPMKKAIFEGQIAFDLSGHQCHFINLKRVPKQFPNIKKVHYHDNVVNPRSNAWETPLLWICLCIMLACQSAILCFLMNFCWIFKWSKGHCNMCLRFNLIFSVINQGSHVWHPRQIALDSFEAWLLLSVNW